MSAKGAQTQIRKRAQTSAKRRKRAQKSAEERFSVEIANKPVQNNQVWELPNEIPQKRARNTIGGQNASIVFFIFSDCSLGFFLSPGRSEMAELHVYGITPPIRIVASSILLLSLEEERPHSTPPICTGVCLVCTAARLFLQQ